MKPFDIIVCLITGAAAVLFLSIIGGLLAAPH